MKSFMKPILEFYELAFVLIAEEIISTFLMPKFLKESLIVPQDWEFKHPPQIDAETGKVSFTNDVIISANSGSITFSETLDTNNLGKAKVPQLVIKWVKTLSKFNYQVIEINPSAFFSFERDDKIFGHFISTALLADSDWKEASQEPLRGSLSLAYTIKQKQFNIKIDDILFRKADNSPRAGVMFYGNFFYEVTGNSQAEKLKRINRHLSLWQEDWEIFQDLVNNKLLRNI